MIGPQSQSGGFGEGKKSIASSGFRTPCCPALSLCECEVLVNCRGGVKVSPLVLCLMCASCTGCSKSLCAPDDYNTESQVHRDFLITLYHPLMIDEYGGLVV